IIDYRKVAEPKAALGCRLRYLDAAKHKAGRPDAVEIHVTGEIVAAGTERRRQARFELHEAADGRRHTLSYRKTNALGLFRKPRALNVVDGYYNAVRALALFAALNEAGNLDIPGRGLNHGMGDDRAFEGRGCKSGRNHGDRERNWKADRAPPSG